MRTRIPMMAEELKRFIEAYRYGEWIENVTGAFDFNDVMKGLEWFAGSGCKGCLGDGGMPQCDVRDCCSERSLENCYFCEDFQGCEKLDYQKETYRIGKNLERIGQIGYEDWVIEQEERIAEDFDNIEYLEKRA